VSAEDRVVKSADELAARLNLAAESFMDARGSVNVPYEDLLKTIRDLHQRYAFDREGRPGALAAVREALPVMERDLFEAIVEDHACEVAAIEEALFQLARAIARVRDRQAL
jgi:hypothetical protein